MKHLLLITVLLLTIPFEGKAQSIEVQSPDRLQSLEAEDQFGEEFRFPNDNGNPLLVFFLPKVDRDKAENALKQVEDSFRQISDLHGEKVRKLFVVEPFRTGRFVNFMMRRQLRDKEFRVATDEDGKFMEAISPESEDLFFWIIEPDGDVAFHSETPFTPDDWKAGLELLEDKLTE